VKTDRIGILSYDALALRRSWRRGVRCRALEQVGVLLGLLQSECLLLGNQLLRLLLRKLLCRRRAGKGRHRLLQVRRGRRRHLFGEQCGLLLHDQLLQILLHELLLEHLLLLHDLLLQFLLHQLLLELLLDSLLDELLLQLLLHDLLLQPPHPLLLLLKLRELELHQHLLHVLLRHLRMGAALLGHGRKRKLRRGGRSLAAACAGRTTASLGMHALCRDGELREQERQRCEETRQHD
jgi:hypothetical protein